MQISANKSKERPVVETRAKSRHFPITGKHQEECHPVVLRDTEHDISRDLGGCLPGAKEQALTLEVSMVRHVRAVSHTATSQAIAIPDNMDNFT